MASGSKPDTTHIGASLSAPVRFLTAMLASILLGIAVLAYLDHRGRSSLERIALASTRDLRSNALAENTKALMAMGELSIRRRVEIIAAEIGLYLAAHPGETVAGLQRSEAFRRIAVQPLGRTGYSAVADTHTLVMRVSRSHAATIRN